MSNGANSLLPYYLADITPGQWMIVSAPLIPNPATGLVAITDIEIEFDTAVPWVGTVYLDNIRIQ